MIAEYTGTIPKRGDRVSTAEQKGVFEVCGYQLAHADGKPQIHGRTMAHHPECALDGVEVS